VIDWSDLRYFLAVAREGSTLAAAKALGINQSTVHRRLAALEAQLGRLLVERHPTGYRLTKLGEEMRPYAAGVEAAVADFERHLASCDNGLVGTVRVTCPPTAAHRLMKSPLLDTFHSRYPGLRVEFVMSDQFLDLTKGEADLAIRQGAPHEKALIGRRIADVPWAVFASRSYIERHERPDRPEHIEQHRVVEFEGVLINHPAARWMRSVAPHAVIAARGNSMPAVLLAVKSGAGLAPLPVPLAERENDLVAVLGPLPELTFPFYLVMHRDMRRTPRVRAFVDFIIAEIKTVRPLLSGRQTSERRVGRGA
jgi:DNA-binding transcriptional LysR family regulator